MSKCYLRKIKLLLLLLLLLLTDAMITKRLTAPRFPGKCKCQKIVYMLLLKLLSEAIVSAKHVLIIYEFVDNVPLTNILKRF